MPFEEAGQAESAIRISLILDSIDRKEAATGPGTGLRVPINAEGELAGHVRAKSIRFHTGLPPSHPAVERLVGLLESLVNGRVEVLERP